MVGLTDQAQKVTLWADLSPHDRNHEVLDEHAAAIRSLGKRVVGDVVEIGRRLTECKFYLKHGHWLPWLEREFGWTEQTALNFMRVYQMAKSKTVLDLNLNMADQFNLATAEGMKGMRDTNLLVRGRSHTTSI
jgi:hypothetical protein